MRTIIIAGCLALVALAGCSITSSPAAAATDTMPVTHGQNDRVPGGARWTQHYFPTADGVELHADVLLPERLPEGAKAPLVLSVGAYFGHSGQLSMEGFAHTGPSARFSYLVGEGRLLERGYGLVMVHSRGFGAPPAVPKPSAARLTRPTCGPRSTGQPCSRGPPGRWPCTASPSTASPRWSGTT